MGAEVWVSRWDKPVTRRVTVDDFNSVPAPEPAASAHSWTPVDLVTIGAAPIPEPRLSGVGYPGSLSIIYSEPEGLKSWLELIVCLEAIRAGRSALWVDFEMDGRSILARLRDLGATDEELGRFLYLQPSDPLTDPAIRTDVEALMAEHAPAVVVVDAMAGCLALHGLSQNDADDVERLYSVVLRPLRAGDAALRIVDHVVKDRETRGRWPTGSQRKLGAADVGLSLEVVRPFSRGHTGLARIRVQKDRLGGLSRPYCAELTLASDADTGAIAWTLRPAADETDGWKPTALMERVSRWLETQPEPVSRNAIEEHVKGNRDYVRDALDALVSDGYASETAGPRRARLFASLKPFRDATSHFAPTSPQPRPGEDADDFALRPSSKERAKSKSATAPHNPRDFAPGDDGYLHAIAAAHHAGHLTLGEALERERVHKLVSVKDATETDARTRAAPAGRVTPYARDGRTDAREADEVERLRAVFVGTTDETDAAEAETLRYLESLIGDPEREEAAS
jgi:AAA domain